MLLFMTSWLKQRQLNTTAKRPARRLAPPRLRLEPLEDRAVPSHSDLGIAGDFNGFFFENFHSYYSDTEGRLAIGGDATITGYGLGTQLSNSDGARDDLIVGGALDFSNGQVFNGNIAVGGAATIAENVGLPHGHVNHTVSLDFAAAQTELQNKSAEWGALPTTGNVLNYYGTLKLTGTSTEINVFHLSAAQLANAKGLEINAPAGSTVLVDVEGTDVTLHDFAIWINGTDRSHVLFNFYQATSLTMQAIGIHGNILAPFADVEFNNGQINGELIAKSFDGNGQLNANPPGVDVPCAMGQISGRVITRDTCGCPKGVAGVEVILQGTSVYGSVNRTTTTDDNGDFVFSGFSEGTYSISIVVPPGQGVTSETVGSLGGDPGVATDGTIASINVGDDDAGSGYQFELGPQTEVKALAPSPPPALPELLPILAKNPSFRLQGLSDINGDGTLDIILTLNRRGILVVDGNNLALLLQLPGAGRGERVDGLVALDTNHDGKADFLVVITGRTTRIFSKTGDLVATLRTRDLPALLGALSGTA
jgi:choice-of-anchor A domain-containing protein